MHSMEGSLFPIKVLLHNLPKLFVCSNFYFCNATIFLHLLPVSMQWQLGLNGRFTASITGSVNQQVLQLHHNRRPWPSGHTLVPKGDIRLFHTSPKDDQLTSGRVVVGSLYLRTSFAHTFIHTFPVSVHLTVSWQTNRQRQKPWQTLICWRKRWCWVSMKMPCDNLCKNFVRNHKNLHNSSSSSSVHVNCGHKNRVAEMN